MPTTVSQKNQKVRKSPAAAMQEELSELAVTQQTKREALLLKLSIAGLVLGITVAIVAFFLSNNTDNPLNQRDAVIVALIGNAITVASGFVFLYSATARFQRFWLARLIYTQQSAQDQD